MGYSFFEIFIEGLIIRDIRDYQSKALCLDFHKVIGVFFRNLLFALCFINFTMLKRPNLWEFPRKFSKEYFYQEYQWLLNTTSLCLNFQNVFSSLNFLCWLEVSRCRKPQKCVDIFLDLWADFPLLSTFELSKLRSGRSKCQRCNRFVHSFASFNLLINFHSAGLAGCVKVSQKISCPF